MTNERLIVVILTCVAIGFTSLASADRPTREEWQTMSDEDRQAARESRRAERSARREQRGQMSPQERAAAREARGDRGRGEPQVRCGVERRHGGVGGRVVLRARATALDIF